MLRSPIFLGSVLQMIPTRALLTGEGFITTAAFIISYLRLGTRDIVIVMSMVSGLTFAGPTSINVASPAALYTEVLNYSDSNTTLASTIALSPGHISRCLALMTRLSVPPAVY